MGARVAVVAGRVCGILVVKSSLARYRLAGATAHYMMCPNSVLCFTGDDGRF